MEQIEYLLAYKTAKDELISANCYEKSDLDFIFAEVLQKSRSQVKLLKYISRENYEKILNIVRIRKTGKPISKIFGKTNFYGYDFIVNENVLSPRLDTEVLVEETLKIIDNKPKTVLDLCSGSGIIGITINKVSGANVTCADISCKALDVANQNAKELNANITFIQSDLFNNITGKYDIIVSNPPYIKTEDINYLDKEVKNYDPILALDGGVTGYDFYERIIKDAPQYLTQNGIIIFEIGVNQAKYIKKLLQNDFKNIRIVEDYNKIERVIMATLK